MSKRALLVTADRPIGEQLLLETDSTAFQDGPAVGPAVRHAKLEGSFADEELVTHENTVIWSSCGIVRKRITSQAPVKQVGWCRFHAYKHEELCCVLRKATFTSCSTWGDLQDTPLDQPVASFWPLPEGVLFTGLQSCATWVLTHPLSELQPVVADVAVGGTHPSWTGWAGERVVWSSMDSPVVATFNDASGRLAIWRAVEGRLDPAKFQELADLPASTPGMPPHAPYSPLQALAPLSTPQSAGSPATTTAGGFSATKRTTIRTPEGTLSPSVFNSAPRFHPPAAPPARTHLSLPRTLTSQLDPTYYFKLLHTDPLPPTHTPQEGHLATDAHAHPLLALLCPDAAVLVAYRLPHDKRPGVSRLFTMPAVSVVSLEATRRRPAGDPARACRELLVLQPGGDLLLLQGGHVLCSVTIPAPRPLPPADDTMNGGGDSDAMATTPAAPSSGPAADDALDGAAIAGLRCPSRNSFDVVLQDGGRLRVLLPLHCSEPLPAAALAALEAVLDEATTRAIFTAFVHHPDGCSGKLETDWRAFSEVLLLWAQDPAKFPRSATPHRPSSPQPASPTTPHPSTAVPPTPQSVAPMSVTPHPRLAQGSALATPAQPPRSQSPSAMSVSCGPQYTPSDTIMSPDTASTPFAPLPFDLTPALPTPVRPAPPPLPFPTARARQPPPTASNWETLLASAPANKYRWLRRPPSASATPQPPPPSTAAAPSTSAPPAPSTAPAAPSADPLLVGRVLRALHCVYEDLKLHTLRWHLLPLMGTTLARLAAVLRAYRYWEHYARDLGPGHLEAHGAAYPGSPSASEGPPDLPPPADIHRMLDALLGGADGARWTPHLATQQAACTLRTSHTIACFSHLAQCGNRCAALLLEARARGAEAATRRLEAAVREGSEQLVLLMVGQGWTVADLETLPLGVALPLQEALQRCRFKPPPGWPIAAYALIGREDIVATIIASQDAPLTASAAPSSAPTASAPSASTAHTPGVPARTPGPPHATPTSAATPSGVSVEAMSMHSAMSTPLGGALLDGLGPWGLGTQPPPLVHDSVERAGAPPQLAPSSWDGLLRPYTQRLQVVAGPPDAPPGTSGAAHLPGAGATAGGSGTAAKKALLDVDGMEGLSASGSARLRFGRDNRLVEVQRLLGSARPVALRVDAAEGDPELLAKQQGLLRALAVRTMALPLGRGALTLGSLQPLPTEALQVPYLCLSGVLPEANNATVTLDLSGDAMAPGGGATSEFTAWPEFHNGVAAGLRLARGAGGALRSGWLVHSRPDSPNYTNAGVLLALGLTGHLARLPLPRLYLYFTQQHGATTAAIMLGMAAARRASCDQTVARMLFLHLPSCHPDSFPEIDLSPLVQSAALLGVGLLYEGSCNRQMAEVMLNEINCRPGQQGAGGEASGAHEGGAVAQEREGYALAAGFALGLIALGRGSSAIGLSDLQIEERLRSYMCGGTNSTAAPVKGAGGAVGMGGPRGLETVLGPGGLGWDPTLGDDPLLLRVPLDPGITPRQTMDPEHPSASHGVSQVVLEQHGVNLNVTSPAATMALALMYLRTNDSQVAALFQLPDTRFALDSVRPDFVLLRLLGRSLVLWDAIRPTKAWVHAQLPPLLQTPLPALMQRLTSASLGARPGRKGDLLAQAHSHVQGVAGACLAIGLRYAGSMNAQAEEVLRHYIHYLQAALKHLPDAASAATTGGLDRQALEGCIDVVALALAVVLAGSGHLPTFNLLRQLSLQREPATSARPSIHYGNHCAVSLAMGLLFLGGGLRTLGTSNQAVAALLIALFPRFPASSDDNRCHLQAFRHLYVLASEARFVEAIDVDSRQPVYVPLEVTIDRTAAGCPPEPAEAACPPDEEAVLKLSTRQNVPGESPVLTPRGLRAAFAADGGGGGSSPEGGGGVGEDTAVARFERVAPCLLPEKNQVLEVNIRSPRYWPQRLDRTPPAAGAPPLDRLYRQGIIYVKKKAGALPYAHDPSGTRSLLSRAFHTTTPAATPSGAATPSDATPAPDSSAQDLVHLTATFSADPSVRAFAHHICGGPLAAAGAAARELVALCRGALYECITGEKTAVLPWYLQLFCLVHSVVARPGAAGRGTGGAARGAAAQGGGSLAVALGSLQLAQRYYGACGVAAAAAALHSSTPLLGATAAEEGPGDGAAWAPLLQPAFLEGLWQQLHHACLAAGLLPKLAQPAAGRAPRTALHHYVACGSLPDAGHFLQAAAGSSSATEGTNTAGQERDREEAEEAEWRRRLFAACLQLHHIPAAADLLPAVQAASQAASGLQLPNPRSAAVPLLAACLPDVPPQAMLLVAACLD